MYKQNIESDLKQVIRELGFVTTDIVLSIPENSDFGDYTSNVALQLAKQNHQKTYQNASEIANGLIEKLGHPKYLERVEVAGPGFLNFFLSDKSLIQILEKDLERKEETGENFLIEFSHLNTHKACHIGHLRNITTGETISRLLEQQGYTIFRVTYGGDIGPHVAKAIWGVLQYKKEYEKVKKLSLREKAEFLGRAYAHGSLNYEEYPQHKKEIDLINKKLYEGSDEYKELWEETKKWSIGYFYTIYARVGSVFDAEIWESEVQELGSLLVRENLGRVFVEDDGAIIFPGEKYGLHNRVFITSQGYPTYEGKELGLTRKEQELFPYDQSLHVVANEQESFFEVTTKAIELIEPSLKGKKKHLSYGMVNLSTGKMSSRKGEVITAESLIEQVKESIRKAIKSNLDEITVERIAIAAIKFSFLKYSLKSDIAFDIEKSVSLQGDSGPYLLYAYARIVSLVNRASENEAKKEGEQAQDGGIAQGTVEIGKVGKFGESVNLEVEEREILRLLEFFDFYAQKAASEFKPNELTQYLLNLAKSFNLFYEKYPILGSEKQELRMLISKRVGETIKLGLYLLGIETVERM